MAKIIANEREMQYLSLDDEGVMAAAKSDPHGFIRSFTDQNVVLHEFQYAPELIPAVVKNSAKRQTIGMSKIHFVDTGLACYLLGIRTPRQLATSHVYGALLESYVYMECLKHMTRAREEVNIYHYRDKQRNKVDLVLERAGGGLIGIEIKASASVNEGDFKGLAKFSEFVGERLETGIVFYSGTRVLPFLVKDRLFFAVPVSRLMA